MEHEADSSIFHLPGLVTNEGENKTSEVGKGARETQPAPGWPKNPPDPSNVGVLELGHFEVLETIGRGGYGVVVKAFDRKLERVVAIKMMATELAATSPARKRFVREARAGAAVRHENVVRIYAVEELPVPYLVMEHVPGESLQHHLDRTGPLDVREVLRIGAQIARGLAAAHATGLVHRDIKPGNVLLEQGETPQVKLTDFGLARAADDASLSQSGMVVGTPLYMAPEQARGESFDHRADLYSLGSVLYVMVSGRPPFRAPNTLAVLKRVAEANPRPIREIIPETPQWLCDIIGKLHAQEPEDRFSSATEVACVLEKCLADLQRGDPVIPPALARVSVARRRRRILAAAALLLGLAIGSATAAIVSKHQGKNTPQTPDLQQVAKLAAQPAVQPSVQPSAQPQPGYTNSFGIEFVKVPAGQSVLGGTSGRVGTRTVEITYDFYIGKYEVTHEEWEKVMGPGTDLSEYSRTGKHSAAVVGISEQDLKRFPVDWVSWDECQNFIRRLNEQTKENGWVYRLPLSTEWEYACRNGPGQSAEDLGCDFYSGGPSTVLRSDRGNTVVTGIGRPCPVGSFPPNNLGIYDMAGNVFELLDDAAYESRETRLLAGGYWLDSAFHTRAAVRASVKPEVRVTGAGFRLIRVPAEQAVTPRLQMEIVSAELQRLNPEFTGRLLTKIVDDRITELQVTDGGPIKDIAPIGKLRHLKVLHISGGQYSDLSPLKGLALRDLSIDNNWYLNDLGPLKGMPLEILRVWGFQGDDLSPLQGMKLQILNCGSSGKKLDLAPLQGMPLTFLCLNMTAVDDLTPLKGMPLETLASVNTRIHDLSPLQGMKLKKLHIDRSAVTDLTPLRGMQLEWLDCDFQAERDTEIVKSITTLTLINGKQPDAFWKDAEKK
jgi:serine/threonine protein kinase/formylglycine-generating enzyme required for sulfatase activity